MKLLRSKSLLLSIGFLLMFTFFSRFVDRGYLQSTDFALTIKLQDNIPTHGRWVYVNAFFENVSSLAGPAMSVVVVLLVAVYLFLRTKGWKKRLLTLLVPFGLVLLTAGEIYGKTVVEQAAPQFFLLRNAIVEFPRYYVQEGNTYPSGHAARSMYVAMLLLVTMKQCNHVAIKRFGKQNIVRILLIAVVIGLVMVIGFSKVLLGQHWLSDIVGGWMLGGGVGLGVWLVLKLLLTRR